MLQAPNDIDFFTDYEVLKDPYRYWDELRSIAPIVELKSRNMVIVTGFREAVEVLRNTEDFSSVNSVVPTQSLPFTPEGDDIWAQVEAHRDDFEMSSILVAFDGARHAAARSLMTVLFTPTRLKANQDYMKEVAGGLVAEVVARGECEVVRDVAVPYVTMVIADILGIPEEDRETFRREIDKGGPSVGSMEGSPEDQFASFMFMIPYFMRYIEERRANPQEDVLTEFANAKYPDGSLPDPFDLVANATFLFGAGQDTSAKLLGNSMRFLTEDLELQRRLREDRSLIPAFLEEVLRLEGSTKSTHRLAVRKTRIGDVEIPAGKTVIVALGGANRDPARWEDPWSFQLKRPGIKEHLAFGRGAHTCVGNPLARAEIRVLLDLLFDQTSEITLSEKHHGPAGKRKFEYEPSFIIRGLQELYIEFKPK